MFIAPIGVNNAAAFQGGDGSAGNPYQIGNVSDLQDMNTDLTAHYVLINDIECNETSTWNSGYGFSPIGNPRISVMISAGILAKCKKIKKKVLR